MCPLRDREWDYFNMKMTDTKALNTTNDSAQEPLEFQLARLVKDHKKLDDDLQDLSGVPDLESLTIQRLKKKKLALKDQISRIRSLMTPDIIA